jgi:hypothetical protein
MVKVMANSSGLSKGYLALSRAFTTGLLGAEVRQLLAIASAEHNECAYCLTARSHIGCNLAEVDESDSDVARGEASRQGCVDPITGQLQEHVRSLQLPDMSSPHFPNSYANSLSRAIDSPPKVPV